MGNKSVLTQIPENSSFLQPHKFILEFPTMPFLRYFAQSVNLPSISTSAVIVPSPFADMKRHGDKLRFDDLVITAIIDEDMRVWEETHNWLYALTKPDNFSQYVRYFDKKATPYHDAILTVLTNANVPNIRYKFTNCHPTMLGAVNFSVTEGADTQLYADITFAYDQYYISRDV